MEVSQEVHIYLYKYNKIYVFIPPWKLYVFVLFYMINMENNSVLLEVVLHFGQVISKSTSIYITNIWLLYTSKIVTETNDQFVDSGNEINITLKIFCKPCT